MQLDLFPHMQKTFPASNDMLNFMSSKSHIEWTEFTWNPATGCTKISPGCKYCYAETMAERLQAMGAPGYENGFKITLHPDRLTQPMQRKKSAIYFVNSMSDMFHEEIPFDFLDRMFDTIRKHRNMFTKFLPNAQSAWRNISKLVPHLTMPGLA